MINRLVDTGQTAILQDTTFSIDVMGRYVCNTWDEAVNNAGPPFDVVVIGAGMHGGYLAEKVFRLTGGRLRVLVLDAGRYLFSTHAQNLPRVGLGSADNVVVRFNSEDPGPANELIGKSPGWGYPWHSNQAFPGLSYSFGGKSLYWGGWAPRLTDKDLGNWPPPVAQYLNANYATTEREIGVVPVVGNYYTGELYNALKPAFDAAILGVSNVDRADPAPLAIQGMGPSPELFAFDKYSTATLLYDAIREDIAAKSANNDARRLFLVPKAHVINLVVNGGLVTQIQAVVNGQPQTLTTPGRLAANAVVVLAASTIESARLALDSFPTALMGRNLMAHLRSNTTVRIKRTAFSLPSTPTELETAAVIVRGSTNADRRFHLQVTAAAIQSSNPEQNMFHMVPDIDLLDRIEANQDPQWIVLILRGVGEMGGDKNASPANTATSWVNLAFDVPDQRDENGKRRAWVNLVPTGADTALWDAMDTATIAVAQALAQGVAANIQYFYKDSFLNDPSDPGSWHNAPPPPSANNDPNDPRNKVRDPIGSTHHEAGTLWVDPDPTQGVTDVDGRFHNLGNAYAAGPALFPAIGSANPTLTALTLARQTAVAIMNRAFPAVEAGFTPLPTGSLAVWQMAGSGGFNVVGPDILESFGGIGLLWYTPDVFGDFILKVEWRASSPTDNSGVFIRFPALGSGDPANDWKLAVDHGYEIQIDDTGYNPDTGMTGDPKHQTGAVYSFAASSTLASLPIGRWNTFEIGVAGNRITVTLNGQLVTDYTGDGSRPSQGHIGLQNHDPGSRVQFRNVRIKKQ
jgi:choline dehydrogenase-like flavoprotein